MIYVHVPYCRSFCTYCDFYSEIAGRSCCGTEYSKALCREIQERAHLITDDVNTLYIGGGTPSVLPLSVFEDMVSALKAAGHGGPFDEFTVEVNPEDIVEKGQGYVEGLMKLGVNRISMGVQSLDDEILRFMNRRHDASNARKAYSILESAGVENISIDLIFGLPQLGMDLWERTVQQALEISSVGRIPDHVSAYQLSVEPGSALARMVEDGRFAEASDDVCAAQYEMLCRNLYDAGYHHYEISNFAQPGREARHNSAYWAHVPYIGFGPGAHSFLEHPAPQRQWNLQDLHSYINTSDFSQVRESESLTSDQLVLERIMLALRTSDGISEAWLRSHCDDEALDNALAAGDLITVEASDPSDRRIRIPESRFFISDSIISELA